MALLTDREDWIAGQLRETERAVLHDVPLSRDYFRRGDAQAVDSSRVGFARWPGKDLVCSFVDAEVEPLPGAGLPPDLFAASATNDGYRQVKVPYRGILQEFLGDLEAVLGLRGKPFVPWVVRDVQPAVGPRRTTTPLLDRLAIDLTGEARAGRLTPPIGREGVIDRVCEILRGLYKNSPCLLSAPGVGKTKIIEGLAIRLHEGVPGLEGCGVLLVEPPRITAKAAAEGMRVEELVLGLADEAAANHERVILACDELHQLFSVQGASGLDAGEMLKPYLGRGRFRLVGATTHDDYRQRILGDPAFERRFIPVPIDEPSIQDAIRILAALVPRLEEHHRVRIPPECVEAAVRLSHRLVRDRFLPDKAIDLLDQTAARLSASGALPQKVDSANALNSRNRGDLAFGGGADVDLNKLGLDRKIDEAINQGDYRRAKVLNDTRAALYQRDALAKIGVAPEAVPPPAGVKDDNGFLIPAEDPSPDNH